MTHHRDTAWQSRNQSAMAILAMLAHGQDARGTETYGLGLPLPLRDARNGDKGSKP
jgi:hypothetical protein